MKKVNIITNNSNEKILQEFIGDTTFTKEFKLILSDPNTLIPDGVYDSDLFIPSTSILNYTNPNEPSPIGPEEKRTLSEKGLEYFKFTTNK